MMKMANLLTVVCRFVVLRVHSFSLNILISYYASSIFLKARDADV